MVSLSVIVCTRNPRPDYFSRTLEALREQLEPVSEWELLIVDNASDAPVADRWSPSWHPRARHVREEYLGLTHARIRGIREASGELLVFVDDDNLLAPDFLSAAKSIGDQNPGLGVFGAGSLEPEFEIPPPPELRPRAQMLALRTVTSRRWSNNPRDSESIPWGAGLCVRRIVAEWYISFVEGSPLIDLLDRKGGQLMAGGDDLFSWVAAAHKLGFGIFPDLHVIHLIGESRLTRPYFLRLVHDHAFSLGVLRYVLEGQKPCRLDWFEYGHSVLHGIRNGVFSMRCRWAAARGKHRAADFVADYAVAPRLIVPHSSTEEPERCA
jgi:glycosyltransferase involved in cell wall biosynthesis